MLKTKNTKKIFVALLTYILAVMMVIPAFAAYDSDAVVDPSLKGSLYVDYKENIDGDDPIAGAEFTLYQVARLGDYGQYISMIPSVDTFDDIHAEDILDIVKEAYESGSVEGGYTAKAVTTAEGMLNFQGLEHGLFLLEESKPAIEHFATIPTFVALPHMNDNFTEWVYNITVEPKPLPGGDLIIEKTVQGDNGEVNRDFHFIVTFKDYDEPLHYKKSDGTEGTLKSGDTVALKHKESIIIDTIPVGTEYTVKEVEANQDGYTTTVDGSTGNIRRTVQSRAQFVNYKKKPIDTGDSYMFFISAGICMLSLLLALLLTIKISRTQE